MLIKTGWWDSSLALWDFSQSNKHCIQLSTKNTIYTLASLLQYPLLEAVVRSCSVKKGPLKNFAKFTGVSSGTGVSCEFCEILKETFFRKTAAVAAFRICTIRDLLNRQLRRERFVSFYGGAKDFIFTCIFLRIITIFIKYKSDIVFSLFLSLDRNFIIYVIDLSTKNKM